MKSKLTRNQLERFFCEYPQISFLKMILFMIFTLGLYSINWIYRINRHLERVDDEAPDSNRGAIIMFILPVFWYFLLFILESLIFSEGNMALTIVSIIGWAFLTFLSLKYLYDFCISYGHVSATNGLYWYILLYLGYYSIILYAFDFTVTLFMVIFPLVTIPVMQDLLNKRQKDFTTQKHRVMFNVMERSFNSRK